MSSTVVKKPDCIIPLIGIRITLPSIEIAESLLESGFDWFCLDLRGHDLTIDEAEDLCFELSSYVSCFAHVDITSTGVLKRLQRVNLSGLIISGITSRTEFSSLNAISIANSPVYLGISSENGMLTGLISTLLDVTGVRGVFLGADETLGFISEISSRVASLGVLASTLEEAKPLMDLGLSLISVASDRALLYEAFDS